MVAATAADVTLSSVRAMSATMLTGSVIATSSSGRPAAVSTVVAVMVAVPGTPAVPTETMTPSSTRTT